MTDHQSSSSGWLGALGRIFSGSGSSQSSSNEKKVDSNRSSDIISTDNSSFLNGSPSVKPAASSGKGLRYLNTTNVESRTPLDISRPTPLTDIISQPRKRQLDEFRAPAEQDTSITGAKRFRGLANHSLLEEPIRVNISERLDATWSGVGAFDASPSSMRSLKSRMSEVPSTTSSGLSSKTRAILQQLERVHTPAKEARKLPTMRTLGTVSEKWASLQTSTLSSGATPPPLKKTMGSVPSRIQLLSSRASSAQRKPYWRDIVRAPRIHTEENNEVTKLSNLPVVNGHTAVHPLFDLDDKSPSKENSKELTETRRPQPVLKGSDGKSKNVFNTKELEDDNLTPLPTVPSVPLPSLGAPSKGFLDDIVFSFAAPKENHLMEKGALPQSDENEDDTSDSDSSESESEESSGSDSSSESVVVEESQQSDKGKKESRPPTSTDSESSATPFSSKSISPQNRDNEKNADDSSVKSATTVSKESSVAAPAATSSASKKWSCPDCFVSNEGDAEKCVCCGYQNKSAKSEEPRVDWDCPDCFVKNKANIDSCQCCGFTKYKSSASSSSKNVFGDKAFKPMTYDSGSAGGFAFGLSSGSTTAKPTFGFGASSNSSVSSSSFGAPAATTASSKPSFGFGVSSTTSEKESTPTIAFGKPSSTETSALSTAGSQPSATSASEVPLFGSSSTDASKTTFGGISSAKPLFGSSASTSDGKSASASESTKSNDAPKAAFSFGSNSDAAKLGTADVAKLSDKPLFGGLTDSSSKPFAFGSASSTTATTTVPALGSAPAAAEASKPLFGSSTVDSTKPLFGGSSDAAKPLFGSATTDTTKTAEAPKLVFGSTDASKPLFGSSSGISFGTPAASADKPAFGLPNTSTGSNPAAPAATPAQPLFGSTSAPSTASSNLFGTGAFGSSSTPLFGNVKNEEKPQPLFGSKETKPLFGATTTDEVPAKRPFTSIETAAVPAYLFGNTAASSSGTSSLFSTTPAAPAFASSSSTPSFGSMFGAAASQPAPSLSASSSSSSLFSGAADVSKSFQFSAAAPPSANQAFQFGQPTLGSGAFNFGGGSTAAPAFNTQPAAFNAPSADAPGGAFAYSSASGPARKMATARRRMVKK